MLIKYWRGRVKGLELGRGCDGTSRHLCSLSVSLLLLCACALDWFSLSVSVFLSRSFITHHLIIIIVLLLVVYYTFDSFCLHHTHCSSSSWLLLSVTYTFISAHLSCAHCHLRVHHFIQYIRGSHSPTIHHIIICHPTVASGIASSCFSEGL
jgi:hypothetical protein